MTHHISIGENLMAETLPEHVHLTVETIDEVLA